jgi:hypothetical protein
MNELAASMLEIPRLSSILKPMMIAAIYLDEFTEARAAHLRLMNLRRTKLAWNPQADRDLQPPHGLLGQLDPVFGSELLGGQSGSKIHVR